MDTESRVDDSTTEPPSIEIGFIGGGSRAWAIKLMNDFALTTRLSGEVRLYDIDYDSAKLNERIGNEIQRLDEAVGDWSYRAVADLETALDGVDAVIISVQDPPAETFAHDLDIPQTYGIYQSVGDTVGPGGTLRAMRAIPQFRRFAAVIREHCPHAWVINYTNPMTVCTRTLYEEFPDINAFGVCHEVYTVKKYLASLVAEHWDVPEPDRERIDANVLGINHFTWIDEARWRGKDLFPLIEAEIGEQGPLPALAPGTLDDESVYVDHNHVTLDLYRRFGILPAAGDRHLAEFVPWYLDVDDPGDVHRWGFKLTPSEYRVNTWPERDDSRRRKLEGEFEYDLTPSNEEFVQQLSALLGVDSAHRTNLNVPNRGQVSNLPRGAVVETDVVMGSSRLSPVTAGKLPPQVRTMVDRHVQNQETLVEAGFDGDVDLAFRAFLNDPLVTLEMSEAKGLFAELVRTEEAYLEDWDLSDSTVVAEAQ